jgi:molybdopterin-guanine dinucleotide biosynthesis protein A
MGRDKALLEHEGEPLVARGARALAALSPEVVLACGAEPRYQDLGWRLALEG